MFMMRSLILYSGEHTGSAWQGKKSERDGVKSTQGKQTCLQLASESFSAVHLYGVM